MRCNMSLATRSEWYIHPSRNTANGVSLLRSASPGWKTKSMLSPTPNPSPGAWLRCGSMSHVLSPTCQRQPGLTFTKA